MRRKNLQSAFSGSKRYETENNLPHPFRLKMATPHFSMQFILDHTEINAVDLSLMSLTMVPVKELVS